MSAARIAKKEKQSKMQKPGETQKMLQLKKAKEEKIRKAAATTAANSVAMGSSRCKLAFTLVAIQLEHSTMARTPILSEY